MFTGTDEQLGAVLLALHVHPQWSCSLCSFTRESVCVLLPGDTDMLKYALRETRAFRELRPRLQMCPHFPVFVPSWSLDLRIQELKFIGNMRRLSSRKLPQLPREVSTVSLERNHTSVTEGNGEKPFDVGASGDQTEFLGPPNIIIPTSDCSDNEEPGSAPEEKKKKKKKKDAPDPLPPREERAAQVPVVVFRPALLGRWCSTVCQCHGMTQSPQNDMTRHDTTRHDATRHDTTRHDTTRHKTTWHRTTPLSTALHRRGTGPTVRF